MIDEGVATPAVVSAEAIGRGILCHLESWAFGCPLKEMPRTISELRVAFFVHSETLMTSKLRICEPLTPEAEAAYYPMLDTLSQIKDGDTVVISDGDLKT